MKKHHFNFLSFLFVIGLMVAGVLATYVATTGTSGFMTRATAPTKTTCEKAGAYGRTFCNKKNLCYWTPTNPNASDKIQEKKGTCKSRADANSTKCGAVGDACCTNSAGQGTCSNPFLTCNPTTYKCVTATTSAGQEKGKKGKCSDKFPGATCKWTSDCTGPIGTPILGYCQGPTTWRCCVPPTQ